MSTSTQAEAVRRDGRRPRRDEPPPPQPAPRVLGRAPPARRRRPEALARQARARRRVRRRPKRALDRGGKKENDRASPRRGGWSPCPSGTTGASPASSTRPRDDQIAPSAGTSRNRPRGSVRRARRRLAKESSFFSFRARLGRQPPPPRRLGPRRRRRPRRAPRLRDPAERRRRRLAARRAGEG